MVAFGRGTGTNFEGHLVALKVDQDKYFSNLLHGYEISRKLCILHHLAELIWLDGERSPDALAGCEAVILEYRQKRLVKRSNGLLDL